MTADDNLENELLLALLDGPFKVVRDDNHIDPHSILVYDIRRHPVIQSVDIIELPYRYPCGGVSAQWAPVDLVKILTEKYCQFRKSIVSHEISDQFKGMTPSCGTVVLVISQDPEVPHRWVGISALIEVEDSC